MRALATSVVVHLLLLALVALHSSRSPLPERGTAVASVVVAEPAPVVVDLLGGGGGGAATPAPAAARASAPRRATDAWERVNVSMDDGNATSTGTGNGNGNGTGNGNGNGTGDGVGFGGVRIVDDVPAPPAAPEPAKRISKARPAKLIYPVRERDVEDEADLFVAKVTVDGEGDVVGARMVKTRPGARGDQAANAIWSFRYLPALDDDGRPIRSTFEQPFQIRR